MIYIVAFILGAIGWTATEYALHRGFGHRGGSRNPFTVEHLAHHSDVSYFAPAYKKLFAAVLMMAIATPLLYFGIGAPGVAGALGFVVMYGAYEVIHRLLHVGPGRTRYGRWARRHHLYHHYRRPKLNHGVTTPIWDWVFGTLEVPDLVEVPRRNALPWMLDGDGEVREELRDQYRLIGRKRKSSA
jgi:sterol desaturase/sphingolipid hydroxylase (fatty acid hydroxylase superfamily)